MGRFWGRIRMPDGFDQGGIATIQPETVLVVDEADLRSRQIKQTLRSPHRQVFTVPTAREALAALSEGIPDLIVVHLDVSDLSGIPLVETLRDRALGAPIVVMTENNDAHMGLAAARAGASGVQSTLPPIATHRLQARGQRRRALH